ncbi:hypothetical protein FLACOL7796_04750 [Flavobacterium collinsii]|uniref:Uncharacterized protein n=1 Tax=Flavobacterium collinsii TaxID=1114861 RepID=A0ABN7ERD0_9FLAO|nr:hypothetical protein FLACOL7796_04750 [Flavobacterium collinsii]
MITIVLRLLDIEDLVEKDSPFFLPINSLLNPPAFVIFFFSIFPFTLYATQ